MPKLRLTFESLSLEALNLPSGLWTDRVINRFAPDAAAMAALVPVIVSRMDDALCVIDGCKRVRALRDAGERKILCGVIDAPLDPRRAGLLRIELNGGRELHPHEKLLFIAWLKSHCDRETRYQVAARLGLSSAERHDYEELASCSALLINAVLGGALDLAVAPEMAHLPDIDTKALITLFSAIPFSRQMQRQLAEWLPEIAFNQGISLPVLLESESLAAILNGDQLNTPQKAALLHDRAYEMRFPLYVRMKNAWDAHSRRLNPDPSHVSFHPSVYFEKNQIEIRIKAGDGASLQELMGQLAAIDAEGWWKLIDPARIGPEG